MKRLLPVLVCVLARVAAAQMTPPVQSAEPAMPEPQNVDVRNDGRCITVRPGDTVHYTLTIEGVGGAHAVFGDLRLRYGRLREVMGGGLPVPDFRSLGGGGRGKRDEGDAKMYHFAFQVPKEIYGGTYRGVDVSVHADELPAPSQSMYETVSERVPKIAVTRHTRDEVRGYCLNVMSNFGAPPFRQTVTNFQAGQVDPPPPPPPPPAPLPR